MFDKINNQVWDLADNRTRKRPSPLAVSGHEGEGTQGERIEMEERLNLPALSANAVSRALAHHYCPLLLTLALIASHLY
ncbi:hypothetical protein Pcinc_038087 [Petrolisthes cinctipes]|uniref:Uncharacterized protein n=1 Tax=Petrolisthes cinctipes TaxID=88211 RepID=A0AAE1BUP8_PETCI|nr:hypothetical protein Pcinc_038087 [Petrolisthes cinctipes]